MKILNLHNIHAHPGGMEVVFAAIARLFRQRGHQVIDLSKNNTELGSLWSKINAFAGAIYSPSVYRELSALIQRESPDVAHVHNLYPQFSTSALSAFYDAGVPVILHAGDYKLTCPTAQHLRNGQLCTKCLGGREHYAAIHNCRGNMSMSVAYAARNAWARTSGIVHKAVNVYACPTRFVADLLIQAGYPSERVRVVYNYCDLPPAPQRTSQGSYIGYLGRISPEKGVDVLIDAARRSGIPTRIAGDASLMPELSVNLPANVQFVGRLDREQIDAFLSDMRALVVPSVWFEVFGLVCVEALSRGIPVIASDIGGLPEVVHHERSGLLVPANDPIALAGAMQTLWDQPNLASEYGLAGQEVVKRLFSPDAFYRQMRELWSDLCAPVEIPSTRVPTPTLSATLKQSM